MASAEHDLCGGIVALTPLGSRSKFLVGGFAPEADDILIFGNKFSALRMQLRHTSHASAVAQGNVVRAMSASYGKSLYSTLRRNQTP
jgi:hypothetical protein